MRKQLSFLASFLVFAGVANAQFANNGPTIHLLPVGGSSKLLSFAPNGLGVSKTWETPSSDPFLPTPVPAGAYKSIGLMTAAATTSAVLEYDATMNKIYMTGAITDNMIKVGFKDIAGATGLAKISMIVDFSEYTCHTPISFAFGDANAKADATLPNRLMNANHVWTDAADIFSAIRFQKDGDDLPILGYYTGTKFSNNTAKNTHVKFGNNVLGVDPSAQQLDFYINVTNEEIMYNVPDGNGGTISVALPSMIGHVWSGPKRFGTLPMNKYPLFKSNVINAFVIQFDGTKSKTPIQERAGFSDITITYGLPTSNTPVSLTSFDAIKKQGGVELKWNTASESKNSHFDILRSTDGVSFTSIATIKGAGTTQEVTNYTFVDNNPVTGTNYYKLRQVDNDGTEKIYDDKVKAVKFGLGADDVVVTLAGNQLSLNAGSIKNTGSVELISISGQKVFSKKVQFVGSDLSYDLGNLAKGVYIARVTVGGEVKTTKLVN